MEHLNIILPCLAALLASMLTFFSGFGLGTILTPVFVFFFPVDVAIALTGVVHFMNNLFKIVLVGRSIDKKVLLRFGLPAIGASFLGAWLLLQITGMPELFRYTIGTSEFAVTPVNLLIALLLMVFALLEVLPGVARLELKGNHLITGGLLSGFFGGLTGIQGAIRSAFLIRAGLTKQAYIATGVAIACLIDFSRLTVYASRITEASLTDNLTVVIAATLSAMAGALLGNRLLKKITLRFMQVLVAIMLIMISIALGAGWI